MDGMMVGRIRRRWTDGGAQKNRQNKKGARTKGAGRIASNDDDDQDNDELQLRHRGIHRAGGLSAWGLPAPLLLLPTPPAAQHPPPGSLRLLLPDRRGRLRQPVPGKALLPYGERPGDRRGTDLHEAAVLANIRAGHHDMEGAEDQRRGGEAGVHSGVLRVLHAVHGSADTGALG